MNCNEFRDVEFEFARGELSGEAAEKAARHIDECQSCREEYETVLELVGALESLGDEPAPETLLPDVMEKISNFVHKPAKKINFARFGTAAAAAVVLVVGAVGVLPRLMERHPADETVQNAQNVQPGAGPDAPSEDEPAPAMELSDEAAVYYAEAEEQKIVPEDEMNKKTEAVSDNARSYPEPGANGDENPVQETDISQQTAQVEDNAEETTAESADDESGIMPTSYGQDSLVRMGGLDVKSSGGSGMSDNGGAIHSGGSNEIETGHEESIGEDAAYICRSVKFVVPAEFAGVVSVLDPSGKSAAQVAAELDGLGVSYTEEISQQDMTEEYYSADAARRTEIEELCAGDRCLIQIGDE